MQPPLRLAVARQRRRGSVKSIHGSALRGRFIELMEVEIQMKLSEMKRMIDMLEAVHGDDTDVRFLYQYGSGKTRIGPMTGYDVYVGTSNLPASIVVKVNYPRGGVVE